MHKIFDDKNLYNREKFAQQKTESKVLQWFENSSGLQIIIIEVLIFLSLAFAPKPIAESTYASELDYLIAIGLTFLFLISLILVIFILGYKKGVKQYKPREQYLTDKQMKKINKLVALGKNVSLIVHDDDEKVVITESDIHLEQTV